MFHQLASFIFALLFIFSAQAAPTCNTNDILSRVYSSIGKYLCLDKFYHGASGIEGNSDALDCSGLYLSPSVALATSGVAASATAKIADKVSDNKARRQLADAAEEARKKAAYWYKYTRANSPSFKPFSSFSRAQYKQYKAAAEDLQFLSETVRPNNKYSRKVAKVVSKKVFLYGAATVSGFGAILTAVDILSPTQAACSTIDYMYIDTKGGCEYLPAIGPNTSRFLALSEHEQDKIMNDYPLVCESYTQLAQKLESDLEKTFPIPEFQITSCGKNNEVTGVDLKYPNGGGIYNVNLSGSSLAVTTGANDRMNYNLILQDKGFGVDSVSAVRATVKVPNGLPRVHIPSDVLNSADGSNQTAQRELGASLKAMLGFTMVKSSVGNQCRDYLEQQDEEAEVTSPIGK